MKKAPILVVLAAGMGSRYGGLKQIDPLGANGEAILDYSIYDAYQAGFRTAVILIKDAIRQDFMDTAGARLAGSPMEIRYAYQELWMLPEGYSVPEGRVKPFGTGHALICAGAQIDPDTPSWSSMPTTSTAGRRLRPCLTICPPTPIPMATAWWATS